MPKSYLATSNAYRLTMIMKNINQYVVEDDENQTAHLNLPNGGYWWYWYGSEMEAHAYYLKLLAKTDPKGRLASRMVKYMLNNRKHATYWNSTRDTALCIEALADFLVASGEDAPDMTVEVYVDGDLAKQVKINSENLFTFDNTFVLEGDKITTGKHAIQIKRKGKGPVYFNGYLDYFSLEDFITKEGLEIKVNRNVYRLERITEDSDDAGSSGQLVNRKVHKYKRHLLKTIRIDGTEDREVFSRPGSAMWATTAAGKGEIGRTLALAPTGGRVAFLSELASRQMPQALLHEGTIEIYGDRVGLRVWPVLTPKASPAQGEEGE